MCCAGLWDQREMPQLSTGRQDWSEPRAVTSAELESPALCFWLLLSSLKHSRNCTWNMNRNVLPHLNVLRAGSSEKMFDFPRITISQEVRHQWRSRRFGGMFALYNVNVNFPSNKWIKQYIIHPAEQRWKMIQRLQIWCGKTAKPWPGWFVTVRISW